MRIFGLSPGPAATAAFLAGLELTWVLMVRRARALMLLSEQEQSPACVHRGHCLHGSLEKDCLNKSPNTSQGKSWLSHSQWLWAAALRLVHDTKGPQRLDLPLSNPYMTIHNATTLSCFSKRQIKINLVVFVSPQHLIANKSLWLLIFPHFNIAGV